MATEADETALRKRWSSEELGEYEGRWIASRAGEVLDHSPSLNEVMERFASEIEYGEGPLFAYVTFRARA